MRSAEEDRLEARKGKKPHRPNGGGSLAVIGIRKQTQTKGRFNQEPAFFRFYPPDRKAPELNPSWAEGSLPGAGQRDAKPFK